MATPKQESPRRMARLVATSALAYLQGTHLIQPATAALPHLRVPDIFTQEQDLRFTSSWGLAPGKSQYTHITERKSLGNSSAPADFMTLEFGVDGDEARLKFFLAGTPALTSQPTTHTDQLPVVSRQTSLKQPCEGLTDFNTQQRPKDQTLAETVSKPWAKHVRQNCKLLATFPNGAQFSCSGTMVERDLLLTARHCTFHEFNGGAAVKVKVYCGLGYSPQVTMDTSTRDTEYEPYAHYGIALVEGYVRYPEYDKKAWDYVAAYSHSTYYDWYGHDIQVCKLDRALGEVVGWNQATTEPLTTLHLYAYPGVHKILAKLFSTHPDREMYSHALGTANQNYSTTDRYYTLHSAYTWTGESGGNMHQPVYTDKGELQLRKVGAILQGGESAGCRKHAPRLTHDLAQIIDPQHRPMVFGEPRAYCQIIRLSHDIYNEYSEAQQPLHGTCAVSDQDHPMHNCAYTAVTLVRHDDNLKMRMTLHNVGNLETQVRLNWYLADAQGKEYLSNPDITRNQQLLHSDIITMGAGERHQVDSTTAAGWQAHWSGKKYLFVWWKPLSDCEVEPTTRFWSYIGTVATAEDTLPSNSLGQRSLTQGRVYLQPLAVALSVTGCAILGYTYRHRPTTAQELPR